MRPRRAASACGLALLVLAATPAGAVPVNATLGIDPTHLAGTDGAGRVKLFAPNPVQPGSSISHWDRSAFPNLLMEPSVGGNLGFAQTDLTRPLFQDIGWQPGSANLVVHVQDPPGAGFNDPTLGGQRTAAFDFAAQRWGNLLRSPVPIHVDVVFDELPCDQGSGVLAQAGPRFLFENFPGAPFGNTWYPGALAEALSGQNLSLQDDPDPAAADLSVTFNSRIDESCLGAGTGYYYGLDGNLPPGTISFVNVAMHELGHGLGFVSLVNEATGEYFLDQPDVFSRHVFDNSLGRHWHQMTQAERRASAVSGRVVWNGTRVTAQAPSFLRPGPTLRINAPASIAGFYDVGTASFGPPLTNAGVSGDVAVATPPLACSGITNPGQIQGRLALIQRGECNFTVKVKNAQIAGAVGVIIENNVPGQPPAMGGTDATITIPAVSIARGDGQRIRAALAETDPAGTVRFAAATQRVSEGAGVATVTVLRDGGTNGEVTVEYRTSDGTATAGEDYLPAAGTLTFPDGSAASQSFPVSILDDGVEEDAETVVLTLANPTGGAQLGVPRTAELTLGDNEPCTPDERTLCLNRGRFRVRVAWRDFVGDTGDAKDVGFGSDDSGLLYFFEEENWEMLVKVLDGCGVNGHYWVFLAATTNVEYTVTVTDTVTGRVQEYLNPLERLAPAVGDIEAFPDCP